MALNHASSDLRVHRVKVQLPKNISAFRANTTIRKQDSILTGIGIMIRTWEGTSPLIRLG